MISYFYSLYRLTEYIKDTHIEHLAMPTLLGLASKYKFTFYHIDVTFLHDLNSQERLEFIEINKIGGANFFPVSTGMHSKIDLRPIFEPSSTTTLH